MSLQPPVLTLRKVRTRCVLVPLAQPQMTAAGIFSGFPIVLIDLETAEGVEGRAYVFAYERLALRPLAAIIEGLAATIEGRRLHPLTIAATLQRQARLLGTEGLMAMAIGGLDMAVWDAVARAAGMPLATYLGAEPRNIQAYRTLKSMVPADAAEDAIDAVRTGFSGVKLKVGGGSVADDVAAIKAVRNAVGDAIAIMVDYNQVLSVNEAVARCRVLDDFDLAWIEEPVRAQDYAGHALIAKVARTPISIGENWNGLPDASKSIAAGASDLIMPDASRIGGVTGWMRTAALAEAHDIALSGHALPELSLQLLAATPTAHWLEYAALVRPVLRTPLEVRGGVAVMPEAHGFGLDWDQRAVSMYTA